MISTAAGVIGLVVVGLLVLGAVVHLVGGLLIEKSYKDYYQRRG